MADDFHPAPGPRANVLRGVAVAAILAFGVWAFFRFGSESCQAGLAAQCSRGPGPAGTLVALVCLVAAAVLVSRMVTSRR